jgi:hypothetical protein
MELLLYLLLLGPVGVGFISSLSFKQLSQISQEQDHMIQMPW